jgi:hypothetical protein
VELSLKGLILEDINHMLNEFSCYGFRFSSLTCNKASHMLAKEALSL